MQRNARSSIILWTGLRLQVGILRPLFIQGFVGFETTRWGTPMLLGCTKYVAESAKLEGETWGLCGEFQGTEPSVWNTYCRPTYSWQWACSGYSLLNITLVFVFAIQINVKLTVLEWIRNWPSYARSAGRKTIRSSLSNQMPVAENWFSRGDRKRYVKVVVPFMT